jgi:hypothetical protein
VKTRAEDLAAGRIPLVRAVFARAAGEVKTLAAAVGQLRTRARCRAEDPRSRHTDSARRVSRNDAGRRSDLQVADPETAAGDYPNSAAAERPEADHIQVVPTPRVAMEAAAQLDLADPEAPAVPAAAEVAQRLLQDRPPPRRLATALRTKGRTCWRADWRRRTWRTESSRRSRPRASPLFRLGASAAGTDFPRPAGGIDKRWRLPARNAKRPRTRAPGRFGSVAAWRRGEPQRSFSS